MKCNKQNRDAYLFLVDLAKHLCNTSSFHGLSLSEIETNISGIKECFPSARHNTMDHDDKLLSDNILSFESCMPVVSNTADSDDSDSDDSDSDSDDSVSNFKQIAVKRFDPKLVDSDSDSDDDSDDDFKPVAAKPVAVKPVADKPVAIVRKQQQTKKDVEAILKAKKDMKEAAEKAKQAQKNKQKSSAHVPKAKVT